MALLSPLVCGFALWLCTLGSRSDGVISSLRDLNDDLVGSTGKFEPFVRETQPDQFMSLH
jgi:hypothetical protein